MKIHRQAKGPAEKALVVIVWQSAPGKGEKQVLVLRLNPDRGAHWQCVTGSVDPGETYSEAALREAQEESGLHFERQPQYLGMEQEFQSRHGTPARERAFYLPVFGGSSPPPAVLDRHEHDGYEWVSPFEAIQRVHFPFNKQAIERAATGLPPLLLSRRGEFYQEGEEITHERTVQLFHESLVREADGHFCVSCDGETLDVILEDNPRYVRAYSRDSGRISLMGGSSEVLRPETLRVRADNSLVCTLENGWEATFLPAAYYEISKDITESAPREYVLHFLGRSHPLAIPPQREGVDR